MKFHEKLLLVMTVVSFTLPVFGQSALQRANKQYELYAFNLAIESYREVLARNPNHPEALGRIADCYRHLNDMGQAAEYYARAVQNPDADPMLFFQYGQVLKALGRYQEARQMFLRFAGRFPDAGNHYAESCRFAQMHLQDPPAMEVKNEYVNSTAADFGPAIFLEGRVVYASSRTDIRSERTPVNFALSAGNQLFMSERDANGYLRPPQLLPGTLGSALNLGPVAYSADGRWVAITKNNFVNGTRQIPSSGLELSLFLAEAKPDGSWDNPLPFPYNGAGYSTGWGTFSPDGNALYFASDRPEGLGGFDIYVSYRQGNGWGTPINLGAAVNTRGNEITPFFDGQSLWFASDWHHGFGGMDIFRAERTGDSWAAVYHAGTGINSPYDDFGYVYDPVYNFGYFVSNRPGGKGYEDLYRVRKESQTLTLRIIDAARKVPVEGAEIDFSECGAGPARTDATGLYSFRVLEDLDCEVIIRKPGYREKRLRLGRYPVQSGQMEVQLVQTADLYRGQVVSRTSNLPLQGVRVLASKVGSGETIEAVTNDRGEYELPLEPNTNYLIRFSRHGFRDVNWSVQTVTEARRFETVALPPAGTNLDESLAYADGENTLSGTTPVPVPAQGYAVQVAAVPQGKPVSLSSFESRLSGQGHVFVVEEKGYQKVRLGIFPTKEAAESARKAVLQKGFKGAFIVSQPTAGLTDKFLGETSGSSQPSSYDQPQGVLPAKGSSGIMVRLAAYRDPSSFERQKVMDIGVITTRKKGPWTILLLSGYADRQEAERALQKVLKLGFEGAYLVEEVNGELRRVQ